MSKIYDKNGQFPTSPDLYQRLVHEGIWAWAKWDGCQWMTWHLDREAAARSNFPSPSRVQTLLWR